MLQMDEMGILARENKFVNNILKRCCRLFRFILTHCTLNSPSFHSLRLCHSFSQWIETICRIWNWFRSEYDWTERLRWFRLKCLTNNSIQFAKYQIKFTPVWLQGMWIVVHLLYESIVVWSAPIHAYSPIDINDAEKKIHNRTGMKFEPMPYVQHIQRRQPFHEITWKTMKTEKTRTELDTKWN